MNLWDAVILGIVQGLTEFLPVSSSGHLVLFQSLLGLNQSMLVFDIAVHWGTLTAVFIYFKKDIFDLISDTFSFMLSFVKGGRFNDLIKLYPNAYLSFLIVLATVPAVFVGLFLKDYFETHLHHLWVVAAAWFVTAILLYMTKFKHPEKMGDLTKLTVRVALLIGLAQAFAIMPGISRSGTTIAVAIFLGLKRGEAARFSFLMGIPAILGAGLLNLKEGAEFMADYPTELISGFFASAVVGYFAILFLIKLIQKEKFYLFSYYCGSLSLLSFAYLLFFVR